MGRCFISYSTQDQDWVQAFLDGLKALGVEARWDRSTLHPGDPWIQMLEAELLMADVLLLVVTPQSMASRWVQSERAMIELLGRPIVPVVAVDCEEPEFLKTRQHFDLSAPESFSDRLRTLAKHLLGISDDHALPSVRIVAPHKKPSLLSPHLLREAIRALHRLCDDEQGRYYLAGRTFELKPDIVRWVTDIGTPELAAQAIIIHALDGSSEPLQGLRLLLAKVQPAIPKEQYGSLCALIDTEVQKAAADTPALSDEDTRYLASLTRDWEQSPVRLLPDDRPMPAVKVRVELKPQAEPRYEQTLTTPSELADFVRAFPTTRFWEVVGEPGSGKTTLLRELAATLAQQCAAVDQQATAEERAKSTDFPLFISAAAVGKTTLVEALAQSANLSSGHLGHLAKRSRLFLLIDGLDEVESELHNRIRLEAEDLISRHEGSRALISSREVSFQHWDGWTRLNVLPLSYEERARLLQNICGRERAEQILADLEPEERLKKLTTNPMTLTVLGVVAKDNKHLPRHRGEIYKAAIHVLMEGRHGSRHKIPRSTDATDLLGRLALELFEEHGTDVVFDARVIDRILGRAMSEWPQEWTDPTTFRKDIAVHTNLLQPTDVLGLKYRFLHRTFLEFFVAEAISQKSDVIIDEKVKQYRDDPRWAEVFVLLAGMLNKDEARKHLVRLADAAGDYRSLLALRACGEAPEGALTDPLADRVLGLEGASWRARRDLILDLARLLEHQNDAVRFFEAFCKTSKTAIRPSDMWSIGEALRRIDSQLARDVERRRFAAFPPVPGRLKELMVRENSDAWCVVEGGSFVFGSEASESDRLGNEPTASLVCVDRCEIGRLVVTADDYAEFEPRYSLRVGTRAGFPAIKVSWFETMCFAEWLNTSQASCEVRLPSEAEWEKAAGFDPATGQKRKYPWGDTWRENHANCGRGANGRPVSADAHPEGDSACGARQMSGNVYEWTLNSFYQPFDHHAQPPEWARQESISTHRTARGGCYGDAPSRCRVTSRQPFDPDERYDYVGFRLVRIRKM